ncbi:MAG: hypothetical protein LKE28_08465 [Sphaerochaeta sp.]|nr:hypothetical protein [Sphaerochaeta sp.]
MTIEWKSEHAECVAALATTENGIAMLPQPFVSTAMMKNPKIPHRLGSYQGMGVKERRFLDDHRRDGRPHRIRPEP